MKTSSLKKTSVVKKASARRAAVRFGRPPKELAGEVDERILDAARKVFVERGFEGASIDEMPRRRARESQRSMPASATSGRSSPKW
jgi:hypothetical protein